MTVAAIAVLLVMSQGQMALGQAPPRPADAEFRTIFGVSASAPDDAWDVVSFSGTLDGTTRVRLRTLSAGRWVAVAQQRMPSALNPVLRAVIEVSPDDVWAVGDTHTVSGPEQTLVMHWDGHTWSLVANPAEHLYGGRLTAVSATTATDAWAVGQHVHQGYKPINLPWDGTRWTRYQQP